MKSMQFLIALLLLGMIGLTLWTSDATGSLQKKKKKEDKDEKTPATINPIGQPTYKQGGNSLYALWYEDGVWHLRTTSKQKEIFEGRVQIEGGRIVGGNFQGLDRAKKAKDADWVIRHAEDRGIDFRLVTSGKTDGINFRVSETAEAMSFKLLIGGGEYPKQVLIGSKNQRPAKIPFSLPAHPKEQPEKKDD